MACYRAVSCKHAFPVFPVADCAGFIGGKDFFRCLCQGAVFSVFFILGNGVRLGGNFLFVFVE